MPCKVEERCARRLHCVDELMLSPPTFGSFLEERPLERYDDKFSFLILKCCLDEASIDTHLNSPTQHPTTRARMYNNYLYEDTHL